MVVSMSLEKGATSSWFRWSTCPISSWWGEGARGPRATPFLWIVPPWPKLCFQKVYVQSLVRILSWPLFGNFLWKLAMNNIKDCTTYHALNSALKAKLNELEIIMQQILSSRLLVLYATTYLMIPLYSRCIL